MIGYYVHHHGLGHLQRLGAIAPYLTSPVTGLSSLAPPPGWAGDWVQLARDDRIAPGGGDDPTAHQRLHWVPRHHLGLRTRMAQVAAWVERARPALLVVDVSVEVTLLARLMGVPVAVVAMLGDRTDAPHELAYDVAAALIAPWPPDLGSAAGSDTGADTWPAHWRAKTTWVGAFSRFDDAQQHQQAAPGRPSGRRVLVLWGRGGDDVTAAERSAARSATPGWEWIYRLGAPAEDAGPTTVWDDLLQADVVVVHGGHNAVAEVAAARRPAVVVAQARPFGEQLHRVRLLAEAGIAVGVDRWPPPERWPRLLDQAVAVGGEQWRRWSFGDGAWRAARAIEELAGEHR